jgi:hypothetical protein
MAHVRGAFSKLLAPGYRKILFESYKERPTEGDMLVNMNTSQRAYEEDFPIAGFGTLIHKAEGGSVTYQDIIEGTVKRYTWSTYGLGFRITQEMMEDDLYGIMGNKMSKALGRSVRNNFEVISHAPYNNAFNTAYPGFVSGESLCDTAHADIRGTSQANRPTSDADLDLLPLQAAIEHFDTLNDESGLDILYMPKMLVYSYPNRWMAAQLLKTTQLPGTDLNDINELRNMGLRPHLSHFLTDLDAWFVLADEHDVNYFDRRKPTFSNSDDFNTGDALFKVTRRAGSGWGDWRGVYGTQGA